jgi:hypothetical protein
MGQVNCVPEAPALNIPVVRWQGDALGPHHSPLLLGGGGRLCVVTQLAPLSGVTVFDEPVVNSARVARMRPGDVLLVHERSADRAWVRITRRDGRRGEFAWPDSRTRWAAACALCSSLSICFRPERQRYLLRQAFLSLSVRRSPQRGLDPGRP